MGNRQFDAYAKFYNLLYKDKNYKKESEYIHHLVSRHSPKKQQELSLLDLACGTGKHLFELASMGYKRLSGSDIAEAMIEVARETEQRVSANVDFHNYSFQEANNIPGKFDVVISMFSAVNYLTSFKDQLKTFQNIYDLLDEDGIFVFDYWNGNAVVRDYSPVKVLRKKDNDAEIMRLSTTEIDVINQHAVVKFDCQYYEGNVRMNEFTEHHHLHYYYFPEMRNLLEVAGFTLLHESPFLEPDKAVDAYDWNISIVAQKRRR